MAPQNEHTKGVKNEARAAGSAIAGEKILARARKIIRKSVTKGSSTHNIQCVDLEVNAYAVIAKPLRWLAQPNPSSKKT